MSEDTVQQPHTLTMEDILISRTDKRGVIVAANKKFQAVSGFSWDDLSGKPHKVVRHPDMPKGLFWYFWHRLENGKPIGAFVKNKTKSGDHYWVFATATPLNKSLMSVRIKPSGAIFDKIQALYKEMVEAETRDGLSPQDSATVMLDSLKDLGFDSYDSFMSHTLAEQITTRNKALGHPEDIQIAPVLSALDIWSKIGEEMDNTISALSDFQTLPINMRIQASKLSQEGLPLGVIAGNFGMLTGQIGELAGELMESARAVEEKLHSGLFTSCVEGLLTEVTQNFRAEEKSLKGVDIVSEIELMERQRGRYSDLAINALRSILAQVDLFGDIFGTMRTFHSGISVTRVMAEIEIGQIVTPQTSSLSAIVNELSKFLKTEGDRLGRMVTGLGEIRNEIQGALETMTAARRGTMPQKLAS